MRSEYVKLDGKKCGFALWIYESNDWYKNEKGKRNLYRNLALAKACLEQEKGIKDPYDYKVWVIINEKEIDLDNTQYESGYYEYYDDNDTWYFVEESFCEEILKIGYFVFEKGDTEHCERDYGHKRLPELTGYIKQAIYNNISYPYYNGAIASCKTDAFSSFYAQVKGSTAKIRFSTNKMIMNLNQARRDEGIRCIPYEKSMDKFLTIHVYITKDSAEPKKFGSSEVANRIQEELLDFIKEVYPESECRYIEVPFMGHPMV